MILDIFIDFTLSKARRFYLSKGDPLDSKELIFFCLLLMDNYRVKIQRDFILT